MNILKRVILLFVVLFLCLSTFSCGKNSQTETKEHTNYTPDMAYDFTLNDINGKEVKLSSYRGKVILLEFWATWCPPCRYTVPELVEIQKKYKDRDFTVIGVSVDNGENRNEKVSQFINEFHINYPVLIVNEDVKKAYNIITIPFSLLIDKNGRIVRTIRGLTENYKEDISNEIERIL